MMMAVIAGAWYGGAEDGGVEDDHEDTAEGNERELAQVTVTKLRMMRMRELAHDMALMMERRASGHI